MVCSSAPAKSPPVPPRVTVHIAVLLDTSNSLVLPGRDGLTILHEIRSARLPLPVIVLTAISNEFLMRSRNAKLAQVPRRPRPLRSPRDRP